MYLSIYIYIYIDIYMYITSWQGSHVLPFLRPWRGRLRERGERYTRLRALRVRGHRLRALRAREKEQVTSPSTSLSLPRQGRRETGRETSRPPSAPRQHRVYRGTSLTREPPPVGPYSSPMPRNLW